MFLDSIWTREHFTLKTPHPNKTPIIHMVICCWNSHQYCANMVNVNVLFLQMAIRISANTTDQKMSPQKNWKISWKFFPLSNNPIWNKIEVQFSSFEGNVSLHQVKSLKINLIKRTVQRISFHSKEHLCIRLKKKFFFKKDLYLCAFLFEEWRQTWKSIRRKNKCIFKILGKIGWNF